MVWKVREALLAARARGLQLPFPGLKALLLRLARSFAKYAPDSIGLA